MILLCGCARLLGKCYENTMHSLEDWIKQLLTQSVKDLNSKYSDYYSARRAVESLSSVDQQKLAASSVSNHILEELHKKIRGCLCEVEVWEAILFQLRHPLPAHIAHDLIDRDSNVLTLGHTRQDDEVQWRLASLVDEALLTLARDFYTNPDYDVTELQKLLDLYPHHGWLLRSWPHWGNSSREKKIVFHKRAWEHPERPDSLPSPEQYWDRLADREREEREEQLRVEREAEERRLELERIAKDMLNSEEIQFILSVQEPEMLLALAGNPQISVHWIQKLINCHYVKGARQIREAAEENIKTRQTQLG